MQTPQQLIEQVVAAERAIADPATPPEVLAAAGHHQQLAYRVLGARPDLEKKVLRAVPDRLVPVVTANVAARREFRSMHQTLSTTLPAWRIVRPAPAAELKSYYKAAERRFGVGWEYLAAINLVETGMGRIRGTSVAGAQGPMQFIPTTWAAYGAGGDVNSYHDAIHAAARLLKANGAPSNMAGALYAYNPSNRYVRAVTAYAEQMKANERAYLGYYHWQVYYFENWLPEGWVG